MRPLILIAATALASCGGNGPANNAVVAEQSDGEEAAAVNDITAIDAATGEAADMAADVDYTLNDLANEAGNNAASSSASNRSD